MAFMTSAERQFARSVANLTYCNPFLPERIELERQALGEAFIESGSDWNVHAEMREDHPNVTTLSQRSRKLADALADRLAQGARPSKSDAKLYEDLAIYVLYHLCRADFEEVVQQSGSDTGGASHFSFHTEYERQAKRYFNVPTIRPVGRDEIAHFFACFYQIRRAFHHIFRNIIGVSRPAARFRAAVWQSIFTHDMRRYRRVLYDRMADFTTLITGPSGTGKELAARAIGQSRYIPFEPGRRRFAEDVAGSFYALNLSALAPTLIESELFGHRRGAFTGAVADRIGWLEACPRLGTVFLDEIGELDRSIQLKLLRVLQTRTFQRTGDTKDLHFHGKIIAATNRDPLAEREHGQFREDFYYRLCSDMLVAPSLHERLRDSPDELGHLLQHIARLLVDAEADALADEVERYIERHLDRDYPWPGNVRELEQCVRNVLVRKEYRPPRRTATSGREHLAEAVCSASLTAEELLSRYCTLVYSQCGSFQEAARRLGLDRRTVKSRINAKLLLAFRRGT